MEYSQHPAAVRARERRKANPEKDRAERIRYREKHRDELRERQNKRAAQMREQEKARVLRWQTENPEKYRAYQQAVIEQRADAQELKAGRPRPEVCEVCGEPPANGKRLAFDHCHSGGHFRGWLCNGCNLALGHVRDNPEILRKLADYIEADRARRGE